MDYLKNTKAQSALEYLSVYSWALILMMLVILLFFLLSSKPSATTYSPSYCYISSGFPCYQLIVGTNSIGSTVIATFTNDLGKTVYFAQSNTFYVKLLSTAAYAPGLCTPSTANPGSAITCVAYINGISPQFGQQLEPQFFFNYSECFSVNCNNQNTATLQKLSTAGSSVSFAYPINTLLQESIITIPPGGGPPIITPPGGGPGSGSTTTVIGQESTTTTTQQESTTTVTQQESTTTILPRYSTTTVIGTGGVTTYISSTTTPPSTTTTLNNNTYNSILIVYTVATDFFPTSGGNRMEITAVSAPPGQSVIASGYTINGGTTGNATQDAQDGFQAEQTAGALGSLCTIVPDGIYGINAGSNLTESIQALYTDAGGNVLCDSASPGKTPFSGSVSSSTGTILYTNGVVANVPYKAYVTIPPNQIASTVWSRTNPYITYINTTPHGWSCGFPKNGTYLETNLDKYSGYALPFTGGGSLNPGVLLNNLPSNAPPNTIAYTEVDTYQNVTMPGPNGSNYTYQEVVPTYTNFITSDYSWCSNGDEAIPFLGWSGQGTNSYSGPNPQFTTKPLENNITETARWGSTIYVNYYVLSNLASPQCNNTVYDNPTPPVTDPLLDTYQTGWAPEGTSFKAYAQPSCPSFGIDGVWYINENPAFSNSYYIGHTNVTPLSSSYTGTAYGPTDIECGTNTPSLTLVANQIMPYLAAFGYYGQPGQSGPWYTYDSGLLSCGNMGTITRDISPV